MYRPEGWKNPYKDTMNGDAWSDYEAGADAMLGGLKKEGYGLGASAEFTLSIENKTDKSETLNVGGGILDYCIRKGNYTLVFIPEGG